MALRQNCLRILFGALLASPLLLAACGGRWLFAQEGPVLPSNAAQTAAQNAKSEEPVVEVRIDGNKMVPKEKILARVRTRAGRPFDMAQVEEDVRNLNRSHMFNHVKPLAERVEGGWRVTYQVSERPTLNDVKFVGELSFKRKKLMSELGFKPGDPLDPFSVGEGKSKLEEFYHKKGFARARVTVLEGDKITDTRAVYVINEGPKQRILWTRFIGNTIVSDGRLRTQIQSKPPFLYVFKGEVDRKQIDEDVERLTAYYRGLGYGRAKIGRELEYNETQDWLVLTFIIEEGPRFKVNSVSFVGNSRFNSDELAEKTKLKASEYFNQNKMLADVNAVQEKYGTIGYVFADIKPDIRYREDSPAIDLVYRVNEGDRYRVGRIDVQIKGDNPHTRLSAVLNQFSVRPGEIADTRKIRETEKRLKGSGLFMNDPMSGNSPKITFSPPDSEDDTQVARRPKPGGNFRGQSPDGYASSAPQDRVLTLQLGRETADAQGDRRLELAPPSNGFRLPALFGSSAAAAETAPPAAAAPVEFRGVPQQRTEFAATAYPAAMAPAPQYQPAPQQQQQPAAAAAPQPYVSPFRQLPQQRPQMVPVAQPQQPVEPPAALRRPEEPVVRGQFTSELGPAERSKSRSWLPWAQPSQPTTQTVAQAPASDPWAASPAAQPVAVAPGQAPAAPLPQVLAPGEPMPAPEVAGGPIQPSADDPLGVRPPVAPVSPFGDSGLYSPGSPFAAPPRDLPMTTTVGETQTGRFSFGVGVTSEAGVVGSIVLDEQNFDWRRYPQSWDDVRSFNAFRGGGQHFRAEAQPGSLVQRYMVSFQDPYFRDTEVSLGLSAFYYDRIYPEWQEQRVGGRVSFGYHFTRHLSGSVSLRAENVNISNPIDPALPMLAAVVGDNALYGFGASLSHDTRDSPFMATEGHLIEATFEQVVGRWVYPKAEIDMRQYFLLHERADGSGRHVLSVLGHFGVTGDNTPIYDHFFAGGYSTIRGFYFRGASPQENGIVVGGQAIVLGSLEYMFPITQDDMLRGVMFCDTGTVEPTLSDWNNRYRVAVGTGLRICVPAMGPAPIALDFAVPLNKNPGDRQEVFSFFLGVLR